MTIAVGSPMNPKTASQHARLHRRLPRRVLQQRGQPGEHGVGVERRGGLDPHERPGDRGAEHAPGDGGGRLLHLVEGGCRLALPPGVAAVLDEQRDPRHERDDRDPRPRADRDAPARAVGDRRGDERRDARADRQHHGGERGERPDPAGEVLLHERRQEHVAEAHARERQDRAGAEDDHGVGSGAQQVPDDHGDEAHHDGELEAEAARDRGREQAEQREADGRQGAEDADRDGVERDVAADLVDDRREHGDGRAEVEGDQHDADQGEERARTGSCGSRRHHQILRRPE
ncbi:vacuolar-type H+-ATPase subunit H [Clavibacter michiganensis]